MKQELYTIQEVAALLGVSPKTLRRWEESGKIKPIRTVGNQRRYLLEDVKKLERRRRFSQVKREEITESSPLSEEALTPSMPDPVVPPQAFSEHISEVLNSSVPQAMPSPRIVESTPVFEEASPAVEQPGETHTANALFRNKKLVKHFFVPFAGAVAALLILFSLAFGLEASSHTGTSVDIANKAVLGASDVLAHYELGVNVPSVFGKKATFLSGIEVKKGLNGSGLAVLSGGVKTNNANINAGTGKLTASNVLYSIVAGSNITISGDIQNPTISASLSAGVTSFQGSTGDVSLSDGSGISLDGLTINNTGVLSVQGDTGDVTFDGGDGIDVSETTITNTDTGSAQNIFKTFSIDDGTTITADNNSDTINFAGGSGITLTGDAGSKTITITGSGGGLSGLTPNGVLYAVDSSTAGTVVGTDGTVLHGVTGGAPIFSAVDLTADVTDVLPAENGGTGVGSTPNNGEILIGNGSGYSLATITQGSGIGVSNGSGSITLTNNGVLSLTGTAHQVNVSGNTGAISVSLPQDIDTTSTPTFDALTLGASNNQLVLGAGNTATITTGMLTSGRTYTLPDGSGTFCLVELNNCSGGGGGGGISGSGSQNFVPLFSSATSLTNSDIYDNGKIGIGTTSPQGLFSVSGTAPGFALAELNQTGTGAILTGSASGVTRFVFDSSGNLTINGGSYQMGGVSVLSSNALGTGVTGSSLTSVGNLSLGSITTGFGSITTANTIQGTDITSTGTTGYSASGNGAGLTFSGTGNHIISVSAGALEIGAATLTGAVTGNGQNITGINDLSAGGTISFSGLGTGVVTSTTGTLSSVPQLGVASGGTGTGTAFTQGSLVFAGASGVYAQDNANLFYNSTNALLGIGTNIPTSRLTVNGAIAGKALSIFNYTGTDQNILVASKSGTEEFAINNNGALQFTGGSSALQTLAVAATSNVNTYTFPDAGGTNATVCLSTGNCLGGGGGGANINLSNLSSVAINTSLLPGISNSIDLGSPTEQFRNAYLASSLNISSTSNQIVFGNGTTGTLTWTPTTSNKVITFPDSTGTVCLVQLGNCAGSGTGITGTGTATQLAYFSGPQALSSDSSLYFDNVNKLFGVGNASPVGKLDVKGAVTGKALAIFNETGDQAILTASASGTTEFTIDHGGNVTIAGNTITQGTTGATYSGTGAGVTFSGGGSHIINASSGTLELGAATLTGTIAGGGQNITGLGTINGLTIAANTGTITSGTWNGTIITPQFGGTGINASGVTAGQLLIGNNSSGFSLSTLTAGSGISISNASGAITISQNGSGASKFTENDSQGVLYPNISTLDVLFGGTATSSAKVGFLNMAGGTPVASISAGTSGASYLTAAGLLQTTAGQTLTLGGSTTGNIALSPLNGAGTVTVNGGLNLASGNSYQINGVSVLNTNTLGSGVVTSSLTTVGALASGSIATGFGTIVTGNTITGTTLNGTTGINTGAGAGTQRIDSSGDLVGIGTITASGTIQFSHFGTGIAHFDSSGNITSSQVDLTNANDIKNTLGAGNGGTGFSTYTNGDLLYGNGSNTLSKLGIGGSGQILTVSGGIPQWVSAGGTINFWQRNNNALSPLNITDDLLLGGTSTTSAKIAFVGAAGNTPSASISAQTGSAPNGLALGVGTIQSLNLNTLTIGGASTGNIVIDSGSNVTQLADNTISLTGTAPVVSSANNALQVTAGTNTLTLQGASGGNIQFFSSSVGTLSSGGVLTLKGANAADITTTGSNALSLDTAGGAAINIGNTHATSLAFGGGQNPTYSFTGTGIFSTSTGLNTIGGNLTVNGATISLAGTNPAISATASNSNLSLAANGTGTILLTSTSQSGVEIGASVGTPKAPLFINGGIGSNGALIVNQTNNGDILDASQSGTTKFQITSAGAVNVTGGIDTLTGTTLTLGGTTATALSFGHGTIGTTFTGTGTFAVNSTVLNVGNGANTTITTPSGGANLTLAANGSGKVQFFSSSNTIDSSGNLTIAGTTTLGGQTYTWPGSQGTNYILQTNGTGTLSWIDPGTLPSSNFFQQIAGVITPKIETQDLLLGGTATISAKFAFINNIGAGTPTASISANSGNNATFLTGTGILGTTNRQTLTLGSSTTGDIAFQPGGKSVGTSLYLASSGNVGIGTTAPAGPLDISSTNAFGTFAQIETPGTGSTQQSFIALVTKSDGQELGTATNKGWQIGARGDAFSGDPDNFFLDYWNGTAFTSNGIEMTPGGFVGITTQNPVATLDVRGASGTAPIASFSGSTSKASFIVDQSGAGDVLSASTSGQSRFTVRNSGVVVIGNNTNGIQFDPTATATCSNGLFGVYCGTARPTKQITLTAEYSGAVLVASPSAGVFTNGFMTASASMSATPTSFNNETYYQWNSTQTNQLNQYTIALTITLPKDWSGWPTSGNAMTIDYNTGLTTSASNALDVFMYQKGDTSGVPVYFSTNNVSSTAKNWTQVQITGAQLSGAKTWDSNNRQVTLYLTLKAWNTPANYVQVGDLNINYLSGF